MNWTGDIYRQTSGDYEIKTGYSCDGESNVIRHKGKIIGYDTDQDSAKRKAEEHAKGQA